MTQLALTLATPHAALVDSLVAAGHTPTVAHRLLTCFERCEFDLDKAVNDHLKYLKNAIAVCPECGMCWSVETPRSWWLKYDRCTACCAAALHLDSRIANEDELTPFVVANPPDPLPKSDPRRLP